jgi:uncharacterized protein (DUF885 family)
MPGSAACKIFRQRSIVRFNAGQGIIPPDFIIEVMVAQIQELAQTSATDSFVVKSLAARLTHHGIAGDHSCLAANIWDNDVVPALRRQVEVLRAQAIGNVRRWYMASPRRRGKHRTRPARRC